MSSGNYLKTDEVIKHPAPINCRLTINFDEFYNSIFPNINSIEYSQIIKYPDENYNELKSILRKKLNIKKKLIFGSGSEDLIIIINRYLERKGFRVGIIRPIFYRTIETCFSKKIIFIKESNIKGFDYSKVDAVWINRPNLFTGEVINKHFVLKLIRDNPTVLFIIDEAAIFSIADWRKQTLMNCNIPKNVIIVGSFSKMFGIASLRVGFATGNQTILNGIKKLGTTFPVSSIASFFLIHLLRNLKFLSTINKRIEKNKKLVESILKKEFNVTVKNSALNCIFLRNKYDPDFYNKLIEIGILGLKLDCIPGILEKGWIRICIPSSEKITNKIISRLKTIKKMTNHE